MTGSLAHVPRAVGGLAHASLHGSGALAHIPKPPQLNDLGLVQPGPLSPSATVGTVVGSISGQTNGSTLTLINGLGLFALDGSNNLVTTASPITAGLYSVQIQESLVGYVTKTSTLITVCGDPSSTCSSTAAFLAALGAAHPGDTIALAPGKYALGASFNNHNFASPGVTVISLDSSNPAVITRTYMHNCSGMTFSGVTFDITGQTDPYAVRFYSCTNLSLVNCFVHGNVSANPTGEASAGIYINNCTNFTVSGCEISHTRIGISHWVTTGLTIQYNLIHDTAVDHIQGGWAVNPVINANVTLNTAPNPGAHQDSCQFWTTGMNAANPSSNVQITNNLFMRGTAYTVNPGGGEGGGIPQGPFLGNEASVAYQGVTITNNTMLGLTFNGLNVYQGNNPTITGNNVVPFTDQTSWLNVVSGTGTITVTGNKGSKQVVNGSSGAPYTGNTAVAAVTGHSDPACKAYVSAWIAANNPSAKILAALAGYY